MNSTPPSRRVGRVFGSLCRPPFAIAEEVTAEFCEPCETDDECGAGVCYNSAYDGLAEDFEVMGECLTSCDADSPCPLGFECASAVGGDYCMAIEGTCGSCVDGDGDGFGDGRCGFADTITQHDCDDTDSAAWFDQEDMNHAFPESCGEVDRNCNGLSDASEVVGPGEWGAIHCTTCDDACEGRC